MIEIEERKYKGESLQWVEVHGNVYPMWRLRKYPTKVMIFICLITTMGGYIDFCLLTQDYYD